MNESLNNFTACSLKLLVENWKILHLHPSLARNTRIIIVLIDTFRDMYDMVVDYRLSSK